MLQCNSACSNTSIIGTHWLLFMILLAAYGHCCYLSGFLFKAVLTSSVRMCTVRLSPSHDVATANPFWQSKRCASRKIYDRPAKMRSLRMDLLGTILNAEIYHCKTKRAAYRVWRAARIYGRNEDNNIVVVVSYKQRQ